MVLCLSSWSSASELCAGIEIQIVDDMRIAEENFSSEYADRAEKVLMDIASGVPGELNEYERGFQRLNAEKIIKGYKLKLEAIKARDSGESNGSQIREYCEFIATQAFWHG